MDNINLFILTLVFYLCAIVPYELMAQKPSNVQQTSIRAPTNVKIDGKSTEWNDQFQAYNRATSLFYTIANDNENLYLVVQAKDVVALYKILGAGIKFKINVSGKKIDKNTITVNYPFFYDNDRPHFNFKNLPKTDPGTITSLLAADSLMKLFNSKLETKTKEIRIGGIKGLDTIISVYNEDGIVARQAFDNKLAYTYELALPLKYLNLNANNRMSFAYHIVLPKVTSAGMGIVKRIGVSGMTVISAANGGRDLPTKDQAFEMTNETDFWGEYTLAKK